MKLNSFEYIRDDALLTLERELVEHLDRIVKYREVIRGRTKNEAIAETIYSLLDLLYAPPTRRAVVHYIRMQLSLSVPVKTLRKSLEKLLSK